MSRTLHHVRDDYKTTNTHRATSFASTIIKPFPLIRHVPGIPQQPSLPTMHTRISYHQPYSFRRHTRYNSSQQAQLVHRSHRAFPTASGAVIRNTFLSFPRTHLIQLWPFPATLCTARSQPSYVLHVLIHHGASSHYYHAYYSAQCVMFAMTHKTMTTL